MRRILIGPLVNAAVFFLLVSPGWAVEVDELAQDPQWLALIQFQPIQTAPSGASSAQNFSSGSFAVKDPSFFLSAEPRTPQTELVALAEALKSESAQAVACRFPARSAWLRSKKESLRFGLDQCAGLKEYIERAPAQSVALVFASENVSQPASMMGHVFLRMSGFNRVGLKVDHAVSFFTDLRDWNIPRLIWESLITGRKGFYSLTPYDQSRLYYRFTESRNVWEYELSLSDFDRTLLHYALFELKSIKLDYHYISFNCATLIFNLLGIVHPEILAQRGLWITPLDVVRSAHQSGMVERQYLTASSRWLIRALIESSELSSQDIDFIKKKEWKRLIEALSVGDESNTVFAKELAVTYNDYLLENNAIEEAQWREGSRILRLGSMLSSGDRLDFSGYKKPHLTPQDSQFALSFSQDSFRRGLRLSYLPASRELMDESAQYQNEMELRLGQIIIEGDLDSGTISLRSLDLYSATLLQASDPLTGGISGRFSFGYGQRLNRFLQEEGVGQLTGGIGRTYRLTRDIDVYGLLGGGAHTGSGSAMMLSPEAGLIVREVAGMKSWLNGQLELRDQNDPLLTISFRQALNRERWAFSFRIWQTHFVSPGLQSSSSGHSLRDRGGGVPEVRGIELGLKRFF